MDQKLNPNGTFKMEIRQFLQFQLPVTNFRKTKVLVELPLKYGKEKLEKEVSIELHSVFRLVLWNGIYYFQIKYHKTPLSYMCKA